MHPQHAQHDDRSCQSNRADQAHRRPRGSLTGSPLAIISDRVFRSNVETGDLDGLNKLGPISLTQFALDRCFLGCEVHRSCMDAGHTAQCRLKPRNARGACHPDNAELDSRGRGSAGSSLGGLLC